MINILHLVVTTHTKLCLPKVESLNTNIGYWVECAGGVGAKLHKTFGTSFTRVLLLCVMKFALAFTNKNKTLTYVGTFDFVSTYVVALHFVHRTNAYK